MRGATLTARFTHKELNISTHTPHAGRDMVTAVFSFTGRFLLTRPMRGATRESEKNGEKQIISTHTPHAGRDRNGTRYAFADDDFYSHAPCGARRDPGAERILPGHFYSHAPCGARRGIVVRTDEENDFYSHAPCGARLQLRFRHINNRLFLLTRPMRGATPAPCRCRRSAAISTHTPHAGRDNMMMLHC